MSDNSMEYRFSWRFIKSTDIERMSTLCLIASVAATALWFVGHEAER